MSTTPFVPVTAGRVMAIAVLSLLAPTRAGAAMCIDVDLRFEDRPAPAALIKTMTHETASIWKTYGVSIEWTTAQSAARCERALASLDVLVSDRDAGAVTTRATLGSTQIGPGMIDHAPVHIGRAATERLLELLPVDTVAHALGRPHPRPDDVGRALGRVLAHEIGHLLLDARDHQVHGLMRATFHSLDLIRPLRHSYSLSSQEVARLRCREVALNAQAAGETDPPRADGAYDVCSVRAKPLSSESSRSDTARNDMSSRIH